MRHALTKNMCPACGSALFGDFHMQRLNTIKDKISAQDFSKGLDQSVIFDMSLFVMSEFFPSNPNRAAVAREVDLITESNKTLDKDNDDFDKIREQVRRDALAASRRGTAVIESAATNSEPSDEELDLNADSDLESNLLEDPELPVSTSDQDLKVAKLKRLYNESPTLRKTGVSVRRVT
jgi:hypothetical protein